ncbi:MAG: phosphatidylinositol-specific phospholipase C domain-containing protein [Pseudomonadota bacterium]
MRAHYDPAYFRNADDGFTDQSDWMKEIHDDTRLTELAIPGTHDSATFNFEKSDAISYKILIDSVVTQTLTISQQLQYGIRFLDLRVRHSGDSLVMHHGSFDLRIMFGDVMYDIVNFLINNPSETVLIALQEEYKADDNNSRDINATLWSYLLSYSDYFFNPTDPIRLLNQPAILGETRGKFSIPYSTVGFNINFPYTGNSIQNHYSMFLSDMYSKWQYVKVQLKEGQTGDIGTFYLNYLSGSGGVQPYTVVSGHGTPETSASRLPTGLTTPGWKDSYPDYPRVDCWGELCTIAFEGTNILARNYIWASNFESNMKMSLVGYKGTIPQSRTVGVIITDFPGSSLIVNIIDNNRYFTKRAGETSTSQEESVISKIPRYVLWCGMGILGVLGTGGLLFFTHRFRVQRNSAVVVSGTITHTLQGNGVGASAVRTQEKTTTERDEQAFIKKTSYSSEADDDDDYATVEAVAEKEYVLDNPEVSEAYELPPIEESERLGPDANKAADPIATPESTRQEEGIGSMFGNFFGTAYSSVSPYVSRYVSQVAGNETLQAAVCLISYLTGKPNPVLAAKGIGIIEDSRLSNVLAGVAAGEIVTEFEERIRLCAQSAGISYSNIKVESTALIQKLSKVLINKSIVELSAILKVTIQGSEKFSEEHKKKFNAYLEKEIDVIQDLFFGPAVPKSTSTTSSRRKDSGKKVANDQCLGQKQAAMLVDKSAERIRLVGNRPGKERLGNNTTKFFANQLSPEASVQSRLENIPNTQKISRCG